MKISQNYSLIAKIGLIAVSLVFPLTIVEPVQAVVFVDNLSEPFASTASVDSSLVYGSSFTTDNNSYILNSITAPLNELNESLFSINLHADNGDEPGTVIEQLNTTEDILSSGFNNYLFTSSSSLNLSANTTYWLSGFRVDPGNYDWAFTNSPNQASPGAWTIGNDSLISFDGGTSWDPLIIGGVALQFNVDADIASTAVPFEFSPKMGILLVSGLFGIKVVYGQYQASKVKVKN